MIAKRPMGQYVPVARPLRINARLLAKARKTCGFRSGSEAINGALAEFVRIWGQRSVIDLFGTVDFVPGFDHKKLRSAR